MSSGLKDSILFFSATASAAHLIYVEEKIIVRCVLSTEDLSAQSTYLEASALT